MKEQETEAAGLVEGLAIKSALWFEKKLDNWSKAPTIQLSSHKRSKNGLVLTVAGLGTAAGLLGLTYFYESGFKAKLSQPPPPRTSLPLPRPPEVKVGAVEMFLAGRQIVATFRGGIVLNYVEGLQMSMFPSSLERLSLDPRVGINLPPNKQSFAFVLPIKEIEKPAFKRMMEDENERRFLLVEYDRQQNLKAQGLTSGRTYNVAIPLNDILRRVYQNQVQGSMPVQCFYHLVELEIAFAWAEGMRMVAIDQPDLPILSRTLSDDAINVIGNFRPQPFRVYSMEPRLVEESLGLSYGTFKTGGACG